MKKINIIDMFCGGGGESTGLISAKWNGNKLLKMAGVNKTLALCKE